jgi:hypothetical protein
VTPSAKAVVVSVAGRHNDCIEKRGQNRENTGESASRAIHPRNYSWAELMKRVFGYDVLKCDACGGRMRILCAVNPPEAIRRILASLGLPSRPPPIFSAVLAGPFSN